MKKQLLFIVVVNLFLIHTSFAKIDVNLYKKLIKNPRAIRIKCTVARAYESNHFLAKLEVLTAKIKRSLLVEYVFKNEDDCSIKCKEPISEELKNELTLFAKNIAKKIYFEPIAWRTLSFEGSSTVKSAVAFNLLSLDTEEIKNDYKAAFNSIKEKYRDYVVQELKAAVEKHQDKD